MKYIFLHESGAMGYTPRVMSSEWGYKHLILPLSRAGLQSDTVEAMLATPGAINRWVASIPAHIQAAEEERSAQIAAHDAAQQELERERMEALLIHDLDIPVEDLDLSVRSYNVVKRLGIDTVRELLQSGRSQKETERATDTLAKGPTNQSLYQRLVDGGIEEDRIPGWIPRH